MLCKIRKEKMKIKDAKPNYRNMDTFFPRVVRKNAIQRWNELFFYGKVLDVGCGHMPYKEMILKNDKVVEYTGVDIKSESYQTEIQPDYFWDGNILPFKDAEFDIVLLTEVLEHIPYPANILAEIRRVLKPDGLLFVTVPFFWGLHDIPFDEYRYTPFALERILKDSNFEIVEMKPAGRWNACLASMIAQYGRRYLCGIKQKTFSICVFPLVKFFYKKDSKDTREGYKHGDMITGLHCVTKKVDNIKSKLNGK